ncbi:MAG: ATP-binding protein [Xanthomonadales bacterium]|nr:ATP-binding protein [Xanthomonadales bacterium]
MRWRKSVKPNPTAAQKRPLSLRLRLLASAGIFVVLALVLVGYALERAFVQNTAESLSQRLDVYFYHVLANLEVDSSGQISFNGESNDPELGIPGSGLYIKAATATDQWQSSSAMGMKLPAVPELNPGRSEFTQPTETAPWYQIVNGIVWELDNQAQVPMRVMVLEHRAAADVMISQFRHGLFRWLGGAGILLLLAQWLLIRWSLRPLADISDSVAAIEIGEASLLNGNFPEELKPLTENINLLLASAERNRNQYRHDLDALAPGLTPPLAIISLSQAENSAANEPVQSALADMQSLISRHLEVASLSTRRLHGQRVSVSQQVKRLSRSLKTVYPQSEIQSQVDADLIFRGDERDLLELLGNLMENACKYGAGLVEVSAGISADSKNLWLEVADNGAGIPADQVDLILRRGVRGEAQENIAADELGAGHGLGLSIVQHLVTAYQGKLSIKTSPLGGARITIELPMV